MRHSLLATALTALLLVPAAGQPVRLDSLWAFLSSLWSTVSLDDGCGMDPDGRCSPAPKLATDDGCGMDPSGRCSPAQQVTSDAGCGMDPNGCSATQQLDVDAGCGMDPWGRCNSAQ